MNRKDLRRMASRLTGLLGGGRRDAELTAELESHLEMMAEELECGGLDHQEARRVAALRLGGVEPVKERCRDQRGLPWLEALGQDLKYALRGLRRRPGFTVTAVACLALGIGAPAALFSVLNAVLLRRLPVAQPEQLVQLGFRGGEKLPKTLRWSTSGFNQLSLPHTMLGELRRGDTGLSELMAFVPLGFNRQSVTVISGGQPSTAGGEMVSGNYFRGLGVAPVLGRAIGDDDLRPGAPNVVVLSHGYWTRQFGRNASVLGRRITLNGQAFVVVGVAPQEFFGLNAALPPDFWVPLRRMPGLAPWGNSSPKAAGMFDDRTWWWCMMVGRLKPGVTREQAQARLDTQFRQAQMALEPGLKPEVAAGMELLDAGRGLDSLRRRLSKPLRLLFGATGLVLLIACANVATLLLARAAARQTETSVRMALGALRGRLIRQYLTESLLLALVGGGLGVVLAYWGSWGLLLLDGRGAQPLDLNVQPDGTVLGFCLGLSVLTGLLFGLAPALRATRAPSRIQTGVTMRVRRLALGPALVAGQVALSVLLLVGAGLFLRTLGNLEGQDLGFRTENVLVFSLNPPASAYDESRKLELYHRALEVIQPLPGVRSATSSGLALLSGWVNQSNVSTDGTAKPGEEEKSAHWNTIGPSFFETMQMRLIQGRGPDWADIRLRRRVAVVNTSFARRFFPGQNPVGHHFQMSAKYDPSEALEIIGVAGDAKYSTPQSETVLTAYIAYPAMPVVLGRMYFEVRTEGDPAAVLPAIRQALRGIDATLPLVEPITQKALLREQLSSERLFAVLCSVFGGVALVLVAVGLYGTLAYAVTRRTNEIGIRMALGAPRGHVLWMVLRESLVLIGVGAVLGLPAALAASGLIKSQIYGVKPADPLTLAATVGTLLFVGALASFVPARRAALIDPQVALRNE
ncbi:ABC transporter permease [uncultured Paludibaculum sp.]|uniref:ABC transporter permease n=1 Tax=uncultured Paludibaculum sp. TaxID=1765020 RepID=UPI002AAB786A|nr:ABC transporter permease [uncultured Paludibaculum sp.]